MATRGSRGAGIDPFGILARALSPAVPAPRRPVQCAQFDPLWSGPPRAKGQVPGPKFQGSSSARRPREIPNSNTQTPNRKLIAAQIGLKGRQPSADRGAWQPGVWDFLGAWNLRPEAWGPALGISLDLGTWNLGLPARFLLAGPVPRVTVLLRDRASIFVTGRCRRCPLCREEKIES